MSVVHPERVQRVRQGRGGEGPVVWWLSRDQRVDDNWALLHALALAREAERPLVAAFCLAGGFLGAGLRQYDFMVKGLRETARRCRGLGMGFVLLTGDPGAEVARLARDLDAMAVVADFDPLRIKKQWRTRAAKALDCPMDMVDAHNVVPAWRVSDKQEYAARTIRPKIHRLLPEFLEDFPQVQAHPHAPPHLAAPDWDAALRLVSPSAAVPPVPPSAGGPAPGPMAARAALDEFVARRLPRYGERNDPNADAVSGLSPYLHFGQLAPQRAALEVARVAARGKAREPGESFLEELVVRRELADNFCHFSPAYDSLDGAPAWARATLDKHRGDARPYLYTLEELEHGRTHQPLWNAAQAQMRLSGTMHGYLRMYWAKKILEWTASPEQAVEWALALNDRWLLDGRDPNGCTGVLWSVGGLHDRPWKERSVFGTVRYMNSRGCRRKFDVDGYVRSWLGATH